MEGCTLRRIVMRETSVKVFLVKKAILLFNKWSEL